MHQEVPYEDAKAKGVEMMRTFHPCQRNIFLRKVLKDHVDVQHIRLTPSFGHG